MALRQDSVAVQPWPEFRLPEYRSEHQQLTIPLNLVFKHESYEEYQKLVNRIQEIIQVHLRAVAVEGWEATGLTNFQSLKTQSCFKESYSAGGLFRGPRTTFESVTIPLKRVVS